MDTLQPLQYEPVKHHCLSGLTSVFLNEMICSWDPEICVLTYSFPDVLGTHLAQPESLLKKVRSPDFSWAIGKQATVVAERFRLLPELVLCTHSRHAHTHAMLSVLSGYQCSPGRSFFLMAGSIRSQEAT